MASSVLDLMEIKWWRMVSSEFCSPKNPICFLLLLFDQIPSPFDSTHLNVCFHLLFLPCQLRFLLGTLNLSTEPGAQFCDP
ncbi:hypothetical protein Csa_019656 [Cucumis sativus]|uniref:Uncharacterized protein n=1 Tax=Cucumis sativus TaxID=3659 RepID=A0A0A0LUW0_CUCSA|nr:hypothetical protein Csa_019656 [Cucumis sativus]